MGTFRISIAGIMLIIVLLAVDYAVLAALSSLPNQNLRFVFLGSLPMVNLSGVCLAFAGSRLARRREVALSIVSFALVGVVGFLILLSIANLAPLLLHEYLDIAGSFLLSPEQESVVVHRSGRVWASTLRALLLCVAVIPPVLVPALLGGWMARGYRLKLVKGSAGDSVQEDDHTTRP